MAEKDKRQDDAPQRSVEHPIRQEKDSDKVPQVQRNDHPLPQEPDTDSKPAQHDNPDTTENRARVVEDNTGVAKQRQFPMEEQPARSVSTLVLSPDDENTALIEELMERLNARPDPIVMGRDVRSVEGRRAFAVELVETLQWFGFRLSKQSDESSRSTSKEK